MIPHHARTLNAMPAQVIDYIDFYFDTFCSPDDHSLPSERVATMDASQADVVLALMVRADEPVFRAAAEAMVGHRIRRCPPCLRPLAPLPQLVNVDPPTRDQRRITYVSPKNTLLPTTGAWYRFRIFRQGMTLGQFLVRGGQRRDVRLALSRGMIRVENWGAFEHARKMAA